LLLLASMLAMFHILACIWFGMGDMIDDGW
jgi:hypothetical protein